LVFAHASGRSFKAGLSKKEAIVKIKILMNVFVVMSITAFAAGSQEKHKEPQHGASAMPMMQGMMGGMGNPATEAKPQPKKEEKETDHSAHHPAGETK
jgi:hypothetical protein